MHTEKIFFLNFYSPHSKYGPYRDELCSFFCRHSRLSIVHVSVCKRVITIQIYIQHLVDARTSTSIHLCFQASLHPRPNYCNVITPPAFTHMRTPEPAHIPAFRNARRAHITLALGPTYSSHELGGLAVGAAALFWIQRSGA